MKRIVVGITGASGAVYGVSVLRKAVTLFDEAYAVVSPAACQVMKQELGLDVDPDSPGARAILGEDNPNLIVMGHKDFFSPPASGSFRHEGMIVAPCSMGTAGRIANGVSDDLLTRAADVCLKERRPLALLIRESPLSLIHLRNLTNLAEAGATILPAAPGFYFRPTSVEEMVDGVVSRVFQAIGAQSGARQWGIEESL